MNEKVSAEFAAALIKAQSEIEGAVKDSTNPHFRSKYADLSGVIDAIKKPLNDNGIAFFQPVLAAEKCARIALRLVFKTGEILDLGITEVPLEKTTPQAYGSALTYARRYSLHSLGVPSLDDDAEGAEQRPTAPYKVNTQGSTGRAPKPTAPLKTDAQQVLSDVEKAVQRVQNPQPPQYYYYYFPDATPATDEALKKKGGVYNLETCCWRLGHKLPEKYKQFEVDLNTYCNRGLDPVDGANI